MQSFVLQVHDFGWLRATHSPNWSVLPLEERTPLTTMQVIMWNVKCLDCLQVLSM